MKRFCKKRQCGGWQELLQLLTRWLLSLFLGGSLAAQEAAQIKLQPPAVQESLSADQQLRISGSDLPVRGRVMSIATGMKEEFYDLLALKENQWKHKIHLNLYGEIGELPPPRLFRTRFRVFPSEVILQLDVHLSQGIEADRLRVKILELFLYELGLRDFDFREEGELSAKLPPWLVEGVHETLNWKKNRSDRSLYASLFERQGIMSLEELLKEDAQRQELGVFDLAFRVSSGALVMALLNQPEGAPGLRSMLVEASRYEGEPSHLIAKHFPGVNLSKSSLAKWWALQFVTMSSRPAQELYTIAETETELQQILKIRFKGKEGQIYLFEPAQYARLERLPRQAVSVKLGRAMSRLSVLATKAFPSYRPLILAYQKEFERIANRKAEEDFSLGILPQLAEERTILAQVGERVTDYLNWYKLEEGQSSPNEFRQYMELREQLQHSSQSDGGPTARYLDAVEKLYAPSK